MLLLGDPDLDLDLDLEGDLERDRESDLVRCLERDAGTGGGLLSRELQTVDDNKTIPATLSVFCQFICIMCHYIQGICEVPLRQERSALDWV